MDDADGDDDEARFALTSEAGLNDGLAFPFTYLAVALALAGQEGWAPIGRWLWLDVAWRTAAGVAVGVLVGWLLGRLLFSATAERKRLTEHTQGFAALAATFLAYGAAELAEGYGFVAVFVCAVTLRAAELAHQYHRVLHSFVEQIERLLTVVVLVLLGGAVARGLLAGVQWREVAVAAAVLLLVRPLAGWAGLAGGRTGTTERAVIAFFGVRGVGSLFYLAFGLGAAEFADAEVLWRVVALVVVGSVLVHGVVSTPAMRRLDRAREEAARRRGGDVATTPV